MAEGGFKQIIVGLIMFVVFSWLVISVAIDFGAEYNKSAEEIGNGSLNINDFRESAESVEGNVSSYRIAFEGGDVDDIDDASGMFSTTKKFINLIVTPFKLLSSILTNLFKVPEIFINSVLGLLGIVLILSIWRILRAGS